MGVMEGVSLPLVWSVMTSVLGCLLPAGHSLGVINIPEKVMRAWVVSGCGAREWALNEGTEMVLWAAVVSAFVAGAAIGSTVASKIADRIGRKGTLLVTQILAALACGLFLSCYVAEYVEILLLGRLVAGLSAGMATVVVSLYLSEVCPTSLKGVFSAIVPLGFTTGMLIAYILGLPQLLGGPQSWPFLLSLPVAYVVTGVLVLPFAPESPSYCCTMLHDEPRAQAELMRLRCQGPEAVEEELNLLRAAAKQMTQEGAWTLRLIWQDVKLRQLLLCAIFLNVGQQLSGINAVFYYSTLVFRSVGLHDVQITIATLFIFIANVVMSVSALPLLRYCRRRVLLTVSLLGMLACQVVFVVALTAVVKQATVHPSILQPSTTVLPPSAIYNPFKSIGNISLAAPSEGLLWDPSELSLSAPNYAADQRSRPESVSSVLTGTSDDEYEQPFKLRDVTLLPLQVPVGDSAETDSSATMAGLVAMVAMIVFVLLYGGGMGPIPYCYAAESFPCGPRGLAVAIGGASNWGGNFVVGLCFPLLQRHLHQYSFLVFAAITVLLIIGTLWKLPEPPRESSSPERYSPAHSLAVGSEETSKVSEQGEP